MTHLYMCKYGAEEWRLGLLLKDFHPLGDFKSRTSESLRQLLTPKGRAELAGLDAGSYERLIDRLHVLDVQPESAARKGLSQASVQG